MKLIQEILALSEHAQTKMVDNMTDMVDTAIDNAVKRGKTKNVSYSRAINNIALELHKLDKDDMCAEMSADDLRSIIQRLYNEKEHKENQVMESSGSVSEIDELMAQYGITEDSDSEIDALMRRYGLMEDDMPQGTATSQEAPPAAEVKTPPPQDNKPVEQREIAKAGEFKVMLGANEQVSIVDGKGHVRMTLPMVEWKQLSRQ
jgi:hypothetical protein